MPTADATLLPPPFTDGTATAEDRTSVRRLDEVGVENVLGAMIEQKRRASQPSFAAIELESREPRDQEDEGPASADERAPSTSEVFLKAR